MNYSNSSSMDLIFFGNAVSHIKYATLTELASKNAHEMSHHHNTFPTSDFWGMPPHPATESLVKIKSFRFPSHCQATQPPIWSSEVYNYERNQCSQGNTPRIVAYDCGMKYNIIRYFVETHGVELTVVTYKYDLSKWPLDEWDGLFLSNGPGDPTMCPETVESIKYALNLDPPKPMFGTCLGMASS